MAGRANKDAREHRAYGAPIGTPPVKPRDEERRRLLETTPTAEQRRQAIEKQVTAGQEATGRRSGTRTRAPEPEAYRTAGKEGRSTERTVRTRGRDVDAAVEREGG